MQHNHNHQKKANAPTSFSKANEMQSISLTLLPSLFSFLKNRQENENCALIRVKKGGEII